MPLNPSHAYLTGRQPATPAQIKKLMGELSRAEIKGWENAQRWMKDHGVTVASFDDLTLGEASRLISALERNHTPSKDRFTNG